MFELIFIILIIVFVVKQMKKQNGGTRRSTTETIYMNGKPVRVKREQQTYSRKQTYSGQQAGSPQSYGTAQPYTAQPSNSQTASYSAPYTGNYGKKNAKATARKAGAADILARARQNVAENDEDELKQDDLHHHKEAGGMQAAYARPAGAPSRAVAGQMDYQHYHAQQNQSPDGVEEQSEDIRQNLRDLMIMGYQPKLEFKRDFVAEGIEMINRYQSLGS